MESGSKNDYVYYDWSDKISRHYINGYTVASLNHITGEFETEIEMSEESKDESFKRMSINEKKYYR